MAILEVKRLKISFWTQNGTVKAVRDISFKLEKGKTLAIVGESGSGKSVTSKAILGISAGNVIIESGEIIYDGQDLLRCSEQDMYNIRGDKIAMIFQDPLSSLNPIVRVGKQITEAMILKNRAKRKEAKRDLKNMLHHLHTAMMETKDKDNLDEAKINELINDFKEASLKGGEIETSFNKAKNQVTDVSSKLKDIILRVKHKYQGDLSGQLKAMHRKLTKISDAYFLYGIEEELKRNELLLEEVLLAYKDRRKVASADRPALIKENVAKLTTVQKKS
jgi:oligopeptide transport system ATP-binding protein